MQTIYLDVSNKGIVPTIYAKQGEVGRKFTAVLTDAGVPYVLDESDLLSAWYEGTSGIGNYTTVGENSAFTVDGNKVTIELITQMLTNDGGGVLSVSINKTDGSEIATWNIPYLVEKKPGVDSPEAESFYTAFSEIAGQVADYANRAEEAAENLENITPEAIGARPDTWTPTAADVGAAPAIQSSTYAGCYYRMVGDEREWINPPMVLGEEYRTTERSNGKVVYVKNIHVGALVNGMTSFEHDISQMHPISCVAHVDTQQTIPARYLDGGYDQTISAYATWSRIFIYCNGIEGEALGKDVHCTLKYTKQ